MVASMASGTSAFTWSGSGAEPAASPSPCASAGSKPPGSRVSSCSMAGTPGAVRCSAAVTPPASAVASGRGSGDVARSVTASESVSFIFSVSMVGTPVCV